MMNRQQQDRKVNQRSILALSLAVLAVISSGCDVKRPDASHEQTAAPATPKITTLFGAQSLVGSQLRLTLKQNEKPGSGPIFELREINARIRLVFEDGSEKTVERFWGTWSWDGEDKEVVIDDVPGSAQAIYITGSAKSSRGDYELDTRLIYDIN